MIDDQQQTEKRSITEMVLKIFVAHFLRKNLTGDEMISVFDLVEQSPDGKTRINNLIKAKYTRELTKVQINEAIDYLSDFPETDDVYFKKIILLQHLSDFHDKQRGKRHLTERVSALADAGFLHPTLTTGEMICVFDLIEHNNDGRARIRRLIDEQCTSELSEPQIEQAIEFLNDYPQPN